MTDMDWSQQHYTFFLNVDGTNLGSLALAMESLCTAFPQSFTFQDDDLYISLGAVGGQSCADVEALLVQQGSAWGIRYADGVVYVMPGTEE